MQETIKLYEDLIFNTPQLVQTKRMLKNFDPSKKVRRFEVSEDEIIQEDLFNSNKVVNEDTI